VTLFVFVLLPLATGKREAHKRNLTLRDDCRRKQGRGRTQGEMLRSMERWKRGEKNIRN